MTRAALLALLSHWYRQPLQLATLVLGLALATGLWSAVQAINTQARNSYSEAAHQLGADRFATLTSPAGPSTLETYVILRRAGWLVSPVLEGRARLGNTMATVIGVDFLTYPVRPTAQPGQPAISLTDVLTPPGRLFVRSGMVTKIGPRAVLAPIIVTDQVPFGVVLTDIGTAEQMLNRPGQISRFLVLPDQPVGVAPLAELVPDLVLSAPQAQADIARLTDSFHLNLTAFGFLAFAVGLFIVHGTVGLAFEQRRAMVRTLRALGVPLGLLSRLLLLELIILALVAGSLGLLIGYLVAAALLPDVAASLRGLYGAPVSGGLSLHPVWFASGLGMALGGSLLAGAQAIWQVYRMPLLVAPGMQSWLRASIRSPRRMVAAGVLAIIGGLACVLMVDGLVAGFGLLGGLMLGAAFLLPPALAGALTLISRRVKGPVIEWVWADLRGQMPGLSLALMALLLALATNIGVGTMVSSFRLTFAGWLDQRLASELYVTARSDTEGQDIRAWLNPRSDAVLPIRYGEGQLSGQPARIYGIVDHSTYRDHWPVIAALPDAWDRLQDGQSALINEQLARRAGLWTGDRLTLTPGWTVDIVGVYSDYGNPVGQAITDLPALLDHFHNVANRQFGVRIPPDRAAALSDDLRTAFDLPFSAVVNQADIKTRSMKVFEKTFVVTSALNALTLGVASFAILTSLLTLWSQRLPQLAPVWALGLTRKQLARLEMLRSIVLSGLTAVLALPLGLVLAWILVAVINVEAFGWRLPIHLFVSDWVRLGLLAILAGAVAAILPARRLRTTPPSELLKVFANEH